MYHYSNFKQGQSAVALEYDQKTDMVPKVIASGKGVIAKQILEIAKSNNIPIHQNADLVQVLSLLEINSFIPLEVYDVVAKILLHINKLNSRAKIRK